MVQVTIMQVDKENGDPRYVGCVAMEESWKFADVRAFVESEGLIPFDFHFVDCNKVRMLMGWEKSIRLSDYEGKVTIIPKPGVGDIPIRAPIQDAFGQTIIGGSSHASNGPSLPDSIDHTFTCSQSVHLSDHEVDDGFTFIPPSLNVSPQPTIPTEGVLEHSLEDSGPFTVQLLSKCLTKDMQKAWSNQAKKLKQHLADNNWSDHKIIVRTWDETLGPCGTVTCSECKYTVDGASNREMDRLSISNAFTNFSSKHLMTPKHTKNVQLNRGLEVQRTIGRKRSAVDPLHNKVQLEKALVILKRINDELPETQCTPSIVTFEVINEIEDDPEKLSKYKVKCHFCLGHFMLCPAQGTLEHNLHTHSSGIGHLNNVAKSRRGSVALAASTGRAGCPMKPDSRDVNQRSIRGFLSPPDCEVASSSGLSTRDKGKGTIEPLSGLCWGLWVESVKYGDDTRPIKEILDDQPQPGQAWWASSDVREVVWCPSTQQSCVIEGLFRHRDCRRTYVLGGGFDELMCSHCYGIKASNDFRLRVYRKQKAIEKRGNRGTVNGTRLGVLTKSEVVNQSQSYRLALRRERVRTRGLEHRLLMLQARVPSVGEVCREAVNRGDITKFCRNIVLAHNRGAFGGREALWDLMRDVASNLNRPNQGHRYRKGSKLLCQALYLHGGRRVIDCLQTNGLSPSLNTLQRDRRGMIVFRAGIHKEQFIFIASVLSQLKIRLGIEKPVPCFLAEDETNVKRTIRWQPKNDTLLGFCGKKEDNHLCAVGLELEVGEGEAGFSVITDAFENYVVGHTARCVIVNPLAEGLPRLCILAMSTCNRFDAKWVRQQWKILAKEWSIHCLESVGPLLGHASDGDSRRRKLMLQDYVGKGVLGFREQELWAGWALTHSLVTSGPVHHAYGLHDQDFIHNTKKLIGPLDSCTRSLRVGIAICDLSHIITVYNLYQLEEHGLNHEDILRTDRQNWASAQRLCNPKVVACLRKLRERRDVKRELTLGTEHYASICSSYVDIFLNTRLSLRERVVLCAKVGFFFRLWRLWCFHGDHGVGKATQKVTFAKNCIPMQTFLDIQMSVHFVVLLVIQFRDHFSHLPLPLHMTGSDACEQFFSKVGGMKGHERSYDIAELVDCATSLNRLAAMDLTEGVVGVGKSHKKHNNIWMKLHPASDGDTESLPSQSDYTGLETNAEVVSALKEGFVLAQNVYIELQMNPSNSCIRSKRVWWETPWIIEGLGVGQGGWMDINVDGLVEEPEVQGCANKPADWMDPINIVSIDGVESEFNVESEDAMEAEIATIGCMGVLGEMLNTVAQDEVVSSIRASTLLESTEKETKTISPIVSFEDRRIHKSTMVSQLVGNPHLSKDRQIRVKQSLYFNNLMDKQKAKEGQPTMLMDVGTDCAVFFIDDTKQTRETRSRKAMVKALKGKGKGKGKELQTAQASGSGQKKPPREAVDVSTLPGKNKYIWWIGRVQSIQRKYGNSTGRTREPIDLLDRPGDESSCKVIFNWFPPVGKSSKKFTYNLTDDQLIDLSSVISTVSMRMDSSQDDIFLLDEEEGTALDTFVKDKKNKEKENKKDKGRTE